MPIQPRSLLQIAGAPLHPSPPEDSVLLLIDAQLEYVDGAVPLNGIDAARREALALLTYARNRRIPVFHLVHHGKPGAAAFDPQGLYAQIIPELAPVDGESVVTKSLPNGFAGTNLDSLIRATGRGEFIVAGFATHMCVSATTRAALDLGYRCTIVANAAATRDLPHPLSKDLIPEETVQKAALAALADRFSIVVADTDALANAGE